MIEPFASAFESDIEFERYVLSQAVPLIAAGTGSSGTIHLDDRPLRVNLTANVTLGRSDTQVIQDLGLRPLLFGVAWKILDVLVEHILTGTNASAKRFTIADKVAAAGYGALVFSPLDAHADFVQRIWAAYCRTEEYRHSIVHRRVQVAANGDFVGVDRDNRALPTLSVDEQVAFCRMVQRVVGCVITGDNSKRTMARLGTDLDRLGSVAGLPATGFNVVQDVVPVVTVPVTAIVEVDMANVRRRVCKAFANNREIDVIFDVTDKDGLRFLCQLEESPDERITFGSDTSVPWLQRL